MTIVVPNLEINDNDKVQFWDGCETWVCINCLDASIVQPNVKVTSEKSSKAILNTVPISLNQHEVEGPEQKNLKQYNLKIFLYTYLVNQTSHKY